MNILIIKELWFPEPTAKSIDFANELKRNGHSVQVLTGFPSYPQGKIYEGYRQKIFEKSIDNGIIITRVPIYPNHSKNPLKRGLNYLSFSISASLLGPFLVSRPDVIFAYQGSALVGIPAFIIKTIKGSPLVLDINDLWPDSVKSSGLVKGNFIMRVLNMLCSFNYYIANDITVCSPGFRSKLIERKVNSKKITYVPNWSRDNFQTGNNPRELNRKLKENVTNILYSGNLGIAQNLKVLILAAEHFKEDKTLHFNLLGSGACESELKKLVAQKKLDNVTFFQRVNSTEVGQYLTEADLLFVHLKNEPIFSITTPSKVLSYLKTGKPILCGLDGDGRDLLEKAGSGIFFKPEDKISLITAIIDSKHKTKKELLSMGESGRLFYYNYMGLEKSTATLLEIFNEMHKKNE